MKGKRNFIAVDVNRIRSILAGRPRTKATRDRLRSMGFYISDFSSSPMFTVADFDRLVATGEISVRGEIVVPLAERDAATTSTGCYCNAEIEAARQRFRPERIRHLLVGESAPRGGTFFYHANSLLFRQTLKAFRLVFGDACGDGEAFLRFLCARGFYLDDLCRTAVNHMNEFQRQKERSAGVDALAERLRVALPETVILVMKKIAPEVWRACDLAGIAPRRVELPFPRPEHQAAFVAGLSAYLRANVGAVS